MRDVLVFCEHDAGELARSTREVLGEARRLADALGGAVIAAVFGGPLALADAAAHHGADRVARCTGSEGEEEAIYDPETWVLTLEALLAARPPRLGLFAATTTGADLAGRLAVRSGLPAVTACVNVVARGARLELVRATHGGKVHAAYVAPETGPLLVAMPPDAVGVAPPDPSRRAELVSLPLVLPERRQIEVLSTAAGDPRSLDLTEAEVIVAAGRGVGSKENLAALAELADALGGSLAGSRVAVDLGWLPRDRQVGQTGKTVAPRLYFACGISGATQHTVGIKQAENIIAVNVDDGCALFKVADLAVQGDVMTVVPALLRRLRAAAAPGN